MRQSGDGRDGVHPAAGVRRRTAVSAAEARRIALAAQGLARGRSAGPHPRPGARAVLAAVRRLGLLQIDSVNVLARAHLLPLYSRLGAYPVAALEDAAHRAPRRLFEYWGHEASLLPVELQPLLRWRMARAAEEAWRGIRAVGRDRPELVGHVLEAVRERGPLAASQLAEPRERASAWWGWTDVKRALEWLFWSGRLSCARRLSSFERVYDLPERVLPAAVLGAPTPPEADAQRALVAHAARALGVAAERDLRDYFRLGVAEARDRVAELVQEGELLPVAVEGWRAPAYLHRDARVPRRADGRALVGPFDPLIWERDRVQRLFGFRYRIEIYVPAPKRVHGYYVLPFLLGEALVARVDLKADRLAGVLRVQAAWAEPGAPPATAGELAAELAELAAFLGLDSVAIAPRGDLAGALAAAVAAG